MSDIKIIPNDAFEDELTVYTIVKK